MVNRWAWWRKIYSSKARSAGQPDTFYLKGHEHFIFWPEADVAPTPDLTHLRRRPSVFQGARPPLSSPSSQPSYKVPGWLGVFPIQLLGHSPAE